MYRNAVLCYNDARLTGGIGVRLNKVKSKNTVSYYIIRSVRRNGKNSSEIVKKLGTGQFIRETYHVDDPDGWAREQLRRMNEDEAASKNQKVLIPFNTTSPIRKDEQMTFNVGYLFLQQIYHRLGLPSICKKIRKENAFHFDLDEILSRLIFGRILYPSSKLSCYEQSRKLLETPGFDLQHIYRALSVLADHSDLIQAELYKRSETVLKRQTGVLFYDCTNYFFEIEDEDDLRKYGVSKEHRPNPIVQMGLFMDRSGIPLSFSVFPGNASEQLSMKPLEQQIMRDFGLSKFVVCTDAGLSSDAGRRFNNYGNRSFITTQSVRKLKQELKDWCLDPEGWMLEGDPRTWNIAALADSEENNHRIFYKQRLLEGWDEERDIAFDQTLVVSYSLKYRKYQQAIRQRQIERAQKYAETPGTAERHSPTDARRFISRTHVTRDGEIAAHTIYALDEKAVQKEAMYDGFYAVCTNLDDNPSVIAKINHDRWEIEESFRIMKTEFEARPVYLQRRDRIEAHFLTCFIALLIYRILEKELDDTFTCEDIVKTLRGMDMRKLGDAGYIPSYTRTDLTDALHEKAGFRTDYELITPKAMAGIIRRSKSL